MTSGGARVLIVDEKEPIAESYDDWLGEEFSTATVTDDGEVLDRLGTSVDAVVLDRRTCERSDRQLLTRIGNRANCGVVVVTAIEIQRDRSLYDRSVEKPVREDDLVAAVEDVLSDGVSDRGSTTDEETSSALEEFDLDDELAGEEEEFDPDQGVDGEVTDHLDDLQDDIDSLSEE